MTQARASDPAIPAEPRQWDGGSNDTVYKGSVGARQHHSPCGAAPAASGVHRLRSPAWVDRGCEAIEHPPTTLAGHGPAPFKRQRSISARMSAGAYLGTSPAPLQAHARTQLASLSLALITRSLQGQWRRKKETKLHSCPCEKIPIKTSWHGSRMGHCSANVPVLTARSNPSQTSAATGCRYLFRRSFGCAGPGRETTVFMGCL